MYGDGCKLWMEVSLPVYTSCLLKVSILTLMTRLFGRSLSFMARQLDAPPTVHFTHCSRVHFALRLADVLGRPITEFPVAEAWRVHAVRTCCSEGSGTPAPPAV